MTTEQKLQIMEFRRNEIGYAEIGEVMGMNKNTVASFCRRNQIGKGAEAAVTACKQCGSFIFQKKGRREQLFCTKDCRIIWWNDHREQKAMKDVYTITCAGCGKTVESYGNRKRKYCTHACYVEAKRRRGKHDE